MSSLPQNVRPDLVPPPSEPPICFQCSGPSIKRITQEGNPNGNAGRPYFKCSSCSKFLVFADPRGNLPENPPCQECGEPSKQQITGSYSQTQSPFRALHYVCSLGKCDFYEPVLEAGRQKVLTADEVTSMISQGLI
ncbi:hypothetical protein QBC35DRAFT_443502 [Podospora australis]|uniref:GRF-like zinc ribbon domain-containing protein n=1 Tax=Podospora australis TaxID=1536484 RepID=A0AAN7ADN7_9PEZI|nr:hypothetical protein QBC35DRAFT_443502 [Podospora australis]